MESGTCCFSNAGSASLEVKGYIRDKGGEAVGLDSGYLMTGWVDSVFSRVVAAMTEQINANMGQTSLNTAKIWILLVGLGVCILLVIFKVYLGRHYKGKRDKINLEFRRAENAIEHNAQNHGEFLKYQPGFIKVIDFLASCL